MNHWHDEVMAWWGGERVRFAFIVAPLAFPAVMALLFALTNPWPDALLFAPWVAVSYLPLSYIAVLAVGVPVYRFLCARNLTAFWVAPVAGFVAGTAACITLFFLAVVTLGFHLSPIGKDLTVITVLPGAFLIGGLPGAAIGTIVWLIARPDRQSSMRSSQ
jgi:hypothetical protein